MPPKSDTEGVVVCVSEYGLGLRGVRAGGGLIADEPAALDEAEVLAATEFGEA